MSMTEPQPVPKPAKPRVLQDGRDMFWSLAPLVLACIVLAGVLGMCSLAPRGPQTGPAPTFDAGDFLRSEARELKIPLRLPQLPEGWQANSGRRAGIEAGRTDPAIRQAVRAVSATAGFLTPTGSYLALVQSDADEEKLTATFGSGLRPTGTVDVDGVTLVVYTGGERGEPVWTTRLPGPAQVAITGAGSPEQFRTLAAATQTQPPLPTTR